MWIRVSRTDLEWAYFRVGIVIAVLALYMELVQGIDLNGGEMLHLQFPWLAW